MDIKIDHIVYCVHDLDEAIVFFEEHLGVRPVIGGKHNTKGTHNAIVNLGGECYLEILAVDRTNTHVQPPRWMGVDLITSPAITRWCLKSSTLLDDATFLQAYDKKLGKVQAGIRERPNGELLMWKLSEPASHPVVDVIPFLIDWSESDTHPTVGLPQDLKLIHIELYHPDPNSVQSLFRSLHCDVTIHRGEKQRIHLKVAGPLGEVEL